jgi:hypothetical protein
MFISHISNARRATLLFIAVALTTLLVVVLTYYMKEAPGTKVSNLLTNSDIPAQQAMVFVNGKHARPV